MKKLNKLIAIVVSLAIMAMMCAITAFAEDKVDTTGKITSSKKARLIPLCFWMEIRR